jgi:hypothetical protein
VRASGFVALLNGARSKVGTVTVLNPSDAQRLIRVCGLDDAIRQVHV